MFYRIGALGQYLALLALGIGIAIEIHYEADFGFLCITIGSAIFAVATKVKYHEKENK